MFFRKQKVAVNDNQLEQAEPTVLASGTILDGNLTSEGEVRSRARCGAWSRHRSASWRRAVSSPGRFRRIRLRFMAGYTVRFALTTSIFNPARTSKATSPAPRLPSRPERSCQALSGRTTSHRARLRCRLLRLARVLPSFPRSRCGMVGTMTLTGPWPLRGRAGAETKGRLEAYTTPSSGILRIRPQALQ